MQHDRRGDEIVPSAPEWVLDDRLPRRAISLIVGRDGVGKSTLIASLTAGWTTGTLTGRTERVHLSLAEDDTAAVTVPRLRAAGADMSQVRVPTEGRTWDFPTDLDALATYLVNEGITI